MLMASFVALATAALMHRAELSDYFQGHDRVALLQAAKALARQGEQQAAGAAFAQLTEQFPEREDVLLGYAEWLDASGQTQDAERWYARAAGLGQQRFSAVRRYAAFLERQGRPAESIALYQRYLAEYPEDAAAQLDLGLGLLRAKQTEESIAPLTQAAAQPALAGEAEGALGRAHMALGHAQEALDAWIRAASAGRDAACAVYWQDVARLRTERGEVAPAAEAWGRYLNVFSQSLPGLSGILSLPLPDLERKPWEMRRAALLAPFVSPLPAPLQRLLPDSGLALGGGLHLERLALSGPAGIAGTAELPLELLFTALDNITEADALRLRFWAQTSEGPARELVSEPRHAAAAPQWRGSSFGQRFMVNLPEAPAAPPVTLALSVGSGGPQVPLLRISAGEAKP